MPLTLVIKPTAGGDKITLTDIEASISVEELKSRLAEQCSLPASEQRLIFKGQILKDERTVESYGGHPLAGAARALPHAHGRTQCPSDRPPPACLQASATTMSCTWCADVHRATPRGAPGPILTAAWGSIGTHVWASRPARRGAA
jgi:hypothetical protein